MFQRRSESGGHPRVSRTGRSAGYFAALFFCGLAAGCQPQAGSPPVPASAPQAAYVDVTRYLELHPASAQLHALEREAKAGRPAPSPAGGAAPFEAPPAETLPPPSAPDVAPAPERHVDLPRAEAEIGESYALRRKAEPNRAEEAYEARVAALRRQYANLRQPAEVKDPDANLREATRLAEREQTLSVQLEALRERPGDRFFYTPAQLRRRRELFAAAEQELQELRQAQIQRLRQAIQTPRRVPVAVPDRLLNEAAAERSREEARARELLAGMEREERAAAARVELPPADVRSAAPANIPADPDLEAARGQMADALEHPGPPPAAGPQPVPAKAALPADVSLRVLRSSILEDLRAAAVIAGRERGYNVTFVSGKAPDRTQELLPGVRRALQETGRGTH